MAKIDSRYDGINRKKREERTLGEDRIHPKKSSEIQKEIYDNFVKAIAELQKRIANGESEKNLALTRKRLGEKAWSLEHVYGYDLKKYKLETLGIIPNMGKVIPRGSR